MALNKFPKASPRALNLSTASSPPHSFSFFSLFSHAVNPQFKNVPSPSTIPRTTLLTRSAIVPMRGNIFFRTGANFISLTIINPRIIFLMKFFILSKKLNLGTLSPPPFFSSLLGFDSNLPSFSPLSALCFSFLSFSIFFFSVTTDPFKSLSISITFVFITTVFLPDVFAPAVSVPEIGLILDNELVFIGLIAPPTDEPGSNF